MVLDSSRGIAYRLRNLDVEDFSVDGVPAGNPTKWGEKVISLNYVYENVRRIACVAYDRKQILHRIFDAAPAVRIALLCIHHRSRLRKRIQWSCDNGAVRDRHCTLACHCWICIYVLSFPIANVGRQACGRYNCVDGNNDGDERIRPSFAVDDDGRRTPDVELIIKN